MPRRTPLVSPDSTKNLQCYNETLSKHEELSDIWPKMSFKTKLFIGLVSLSLGGAFPKTKA